MRFPSGLVISFFDRYGEWFSEVSLGDKSHGTLQVFRREKEAGGIVSAVFVLDLPCPDC
jgi:hypothetical protein